jgi:hypothetical protein
MNQLLTTMVTTLSGASKLANVHYKFGHLTLSLRFPFGRNKHLLTVF